MGGGGVGDRGTSPLTLRSGGGEQRGTPTISDGRTFGFLGARALSGVQPLRAFRTGPAGTGVRSCIQGPGSGLGERGQVLYWHMLLEPESPCVNTRPAPHPAASPATSKRR